MKNFDFSSYATFVIWLGPSGHSLLIHLPIFNTLDPAFKLCPLTYSNTVFIILSFMRKEAHLIVVFFIPFKGDASVRVGVPNEEVAKRVLQMPAKFTTTRKVYTSFSS